MPGWFAFTISTLGDICAMRTATIFLPTATPGRRRASGPAIRRAIGGILPRMSPRMRRHAIAPPIRAADDRTRRARRVSVQRIRDADARIPPARRATVPPIRGADARIPPARRATVPTIKVAAVLTPLVHRASVPPIRGADVPIPRGRRATARRSHRPTSIPQSPPPRGRLEPT